MRRNRDAIEIAVTVLASLAVVCAAASIGWMLWWTFAELVAVAGGPSLLRVAWAFAIGVAAGGIAMGALIALWED